MRGQKFTWFLWGVCAAALAALKLYGARASVPGLSWILGPTVGLVELLTGRVFLYDPETGFWAGSGILVNQGCAGIGLLIVVCAFSVFQLVPTCGNRGKRGALMAALMAAAYPVTILVNTLRIIAAISLGGGRLDFYALGGKAQAHAVIGLLVFSFFLSIYSLLLNALKERIRAWIMS